MSSKSENIDSATARMPDGGQVRDGLGARHLTPARAPEGRSELEWLVIEQLLTLLDSRDLSFWRTRAGAELDLRVEVEGNDWALRSS